MYTHLNQQKESILNGFDKAGITEAVKSANEVFASTENPFAEKRANEMQCRFASFLLKKILKIVKWTRFYFSVSLTSITHYFVKF